MNSIDEKLKYLKELHKSTQNANSIKSNKFQIAKNLPKLNPQILNQLPPNNKLTARGRLLRALVEKIIALKRFPTKEDLETNFYHLGTAMETVQAVKEFCIQFNLLDVAEYCTTNYLDNSKKGIVYLLKGKNEGKKFYKIGRSTDGERRVNEIKIQLPFPVEKIHQIEADDCIKIERHWHNYFKEKRSNGEWFVLNESDVYHFMSFNKM